MKTNELNRHSLNQHLNHHLNQHRLPDGVALADQQQQLLLAMLCCGCIGLGWYLVPHPLVAIATGFLPLLAIFTLRTPFVLVLGFVIFSFFRIHEVFPQLYPLRIPQLLALGTLASLGWNLFNGQIRAFWSRELTAFALFFALVAMGIPFATNRPEAFANWSGTYVKIGVMVIAIAWLARGPREFRLTANAMVTVGILVGLVALSNKFQGIGLVEGTRVTIGRDIGSMLGDPNDLALVLLFPASFSLAMLLTPGTAITKKLYGAVGFVIVIAAIIATQSRGGLLGIASVIGIFAYRRVHSKSLLLVIGTLALLLLFVVAGVDDRASGGAHEEGIDESAMGRLHAWGAALRMALDHPLTGVGIDNFLSNYYSYSDFWDGQNHAVHSTWFGVLAETGILGFSCFMLMVVLVVRMAASAQQRLSQASDNPEIRHAYLLAQATFAGLVSFMVSGTFLTMGFTWPLYILIGLAVAVDRFSRRKSRFQRPDV